MKSLLWFAVIAVLIAIVIGAMKGKGSSVKGEKGEKDIRAKRPLTPREQSMFLRLSSTFPEHVVLSQVAFSALITSRQPATRNGFNRKMADFVLCSKAFDVLAVIELDDASHKSREREDADRDRWLTKAGYRVVRYPQIPDEAKLLADFMPARQTDSVLPGMNAVRMGSTKDHS
jgi:very-short-patch-repair endonuclease